MRVAGRIAKVRLIFAVHCAKLLSVIGSSFAPFRQGVTRLLRVPVGADQPVSVPAMAGALGAWPGDCGGGGLGSCPITADQRCRFHHVNPVESLG
jgi:hypothetical protein